MSRDIEFMARFPKMKQIQLSEDEIADRDIKRILSGEPSEEGTEYEIEFEYAPMVMSIDDVKLYFQYDKFHTTVKLWDGDAFVIKYKYRLFKLLKEYLTGSATVIASDMKFEERLDAKAKEVEKILSSMPKLSPNGTTSPTDESFGTTFNEE